MDKNKKLNRKKQEDTILEKVYNLILDKQTQEDERNELIIFKNEDEKSEDFENDL
ncbi:hypothetical protein NIE88_04085 [Sporolactobacillus shoreicorticis]|uniref:Uncharacterized protein n=1 Tax=Sporolactobacillus shoreicorticis TaxID=1923877 RepID=A0ABW5RX21_9BACL|nr:hypothetical protein [Sporolactobacillus shoreicorticis]MCO7124955.1 hypothetical protein [Sporolactobacillus shoreicorticis]